MTRLEKLLQRLCPEGVEYKRICDISSNISSGGTPKSENAEYYNGNIPWLRTQEVNFNEISETRVKITSEGLKNSSAKWVPANCVIVAMYGATVGRVAINKVPLTTNQACCNIEVNSEIALYKYVFYSLWNQYGFIKSLGQGSQTNINSKTIRSLKIPVPPLEVQQEVVRILDQFTQRTAELTAELTARKKQYEYYRDALFVFEDEVRQRPLEAEFPSIRNGFVGTITSFFSDEKNGVRYLEGRDIHEGIISDEKAVYVTKEFHNKHLKTQLKPNDIVMVQSGHVGECAVVGDKYAGANCHALIVMSNGGNCDSKYVTYYLQSSEGKSKLASITTGGTVKHILASKIKKVTVPFPPIEEQRRIVAILDRFDALCNDLTSGLPAEIAARQKQYEYYRDKLLTFKERET